MSKCGKDGGDCVLMPHADRMIEMLRGVPAMAALAVVVDLDDPNHMVFSTRGLTKRALLEVLEQFASTVRDDLARTERTLQ